MFLKTKAGVKNATTSFSLLMSFSRGDVEGGEAEGVLEIWGIEPTFSTQSCARRMVVLSSYKYSSAE